MMASSGAARFLKVLDGAAPMPVRRNGTQEFTVPLDLLDRGVLNRGAPHYFARLRAKLTRGDPITMFAIGSSLVGVHAGCTEAVPQLKGCPCPKCCGARCGGWGGAGWALRLLERLNETWPHPGHRLLNLGEAGGEVLSAVAKCPRNYITPVGEVDVFLVDFSTTNAPAIAQVMQTLLASGADGWPALVVPVQFTIFTDRKELRPAGTPDKRYLCQLARSQMGCERRSSTDCSIATKGPAGSPPEPPPPSCRAEPGSYYSGVLQRFHNGSAGAQSEMSALLQRAEKLHGSSRFLRIQHGISVALAGLRQRYQLPAVSVFAAYGEEFETHAHGLSVLDLTGDGLHPHRKTSSESMVAQLVEHVLRQGIAAAPQLRAAPPPGVGMWGSRDAMCFDFDPEGAEVLRRPELPTNRSRVSAIATRPSPRIAHNNGWEFVQFEPASRSTFKPGLLTNQPGATLALEIDTQAISGGGGSRVTLFYLSSYEGMGRALVSCHRCSCEPATIDASITDGRVSISAPFARSVSRHPQCQLRLRSEATSNGNKFKLLRMIVESEPSSAGARLRS